MLGARGNERKFDRLNVEITTLLNLTKMLPRVHSDNDKTIRTDGKWCECREDPLGYLGNDPVGMISERQLND